MKLLFYLFYVLLKKLEFGDQISSSISYSIHLIINTILLLFYLFDYVFQFNFSFIIYFIVYISLVILFFIPNLILGINFEHCKVKLQLHNKFGANKLNTYQKVFNIFLSLVLLIDLSFIIALIVKVERL